MNGIYHILIIMAPTPLHPRAILFLEYSRIFSAHLRLYKCHRKPHLGSVFDGIGSLEFYPPDGISGVSESGEVEEALNADARGRYDLPMIMTR